jgi:hypothetical protein
MITNNFFAITKYKESFMKKYLPLLFIPALALVAEPVCEKCQKIREYNAAHPENNTIWYEDYQKDHPDVRPTPSDNNKDSSKILLAGCGCGKGRGKGEEKPKGSRGT